MMNKNRKVIEQVTFPDGVVIKNIKIEELLEQLANTYTFMAGFLPEDFEDITPFDVLNDINNIIYEQS